ncbi:CPBP family intramembrane glutamic endopeptidase [Nocardioides silvaticus]|nr:CPBP family intramembrane glutamic endopeptidase [Nocardioides silvaticus]
MPTSPATAARTNPRAAVPTRPLLAFAAIAVPTGWVLLSTAQLLDAPADPFVLLTLLLGLVLPAVVLLRRDPRTTLRATLRDLVRPTRPAWLMAPAALGIPLVAWLLAAALDGTDGDATAAVGAFAGAALGSLVIVNLWEELAWTGFFQRGAMARWGYLGGSLVTAVLFAAIHLPLAFDGADGLRDVLVGVAALLGAGVGMRLLIGALDLWAGSSLLAVAMLHASFNGAAEIIEPDVDWVRYAVVLVAGVLAAALLGRKDRA